MQVRRYLPILGALLLLACGSESQGPSEDVPKGDQSQVPDQGTPPTGNAAVSGKVKLIKNFPNQVVDLLRQYLTSGNAPIHKGNLYLQLCSDPDCSQVVLTKKALEEPYLFSTGFPKEVTVSGLPAGTFHARFVIDTAYSQAYGDGFSDRGAFGPFDIVQSQAGSEVATGKNPPPGTVEVTLVDGQTVDLGTLDLGTILFEDLSAPSPVEEGRLLVASSGKSVFRNEIKVVDLSTYTVEKAIPLKLKEADFKGDICGFVRGQGGLVYVVAVGEAGAYVFPFNPDSLSFFETDPLLIPHPDYKGGEPAGLDPEKYPWPCRGVSITKNNKEFLYLIAFKGAGSLTNSAPYPLVVVDVTSLAKGQRGAVVEKYGPEVDAFFDTSRILRAAATDGERLYLLEASWSKLVDKNTVWVFEVGSDGKVSLTSAKIESGTAEDRCDSSNNWVPAMTIVDWGGKKRLLVGNDNDISVYETDGTLLSTIDIQSYGSLITSFALSPDGKILYAMPNCKSPTKKAKVAAGKGDKTVDLDRHGIVPIDLSSDPTKPSLLYEDRDFDGDGTEDGGIDLEFLFLKASLLRWCETCAGVVPPTVYTGPEIAAGTKALFLRGTGIQSDEKNSSGLGQVGDIGVFAVDNGKGLIFRGYNIWLDGPSARWGFDLDPQNDDLSTAALLYLPK